MNEWSHLTGVVVLGLDGHVQAEEKKKREEADQKNLLKVTKEYSKEDLDSAVAKITVAAMKYDK